MKKHLFLASLVALSITACNPAKNAGQSPIGGGAKTEQTTDMAQQGNTITEKHWKLVELEGQPVMMAENQETEVHFVLHSEGNKVIGNGVCNVINGTYTLSEGNRIRFSKMATTMMYCPVIEKEAEFLQVFELADNYSLNGDILTLNVGRRAPLAVFHAVYLD
ncbi:MAG: META domain-containing protein [Hymenobacteraceae bacterium]|nr:META domain-containing protein [Hymenobacteraceae bacterium]